MYFDDEGLDCNWFKKTFDFLFSYYVRNWVQKHTMTVTSEYIQKAIIDIQSWPGHHFKSLPCCTDVKYSLSCSTDWGYPLFHSRFKLYICHLQYSLPQVLYNHGLHQSFQIHYAYKLYKQTKFLKKKTLSYNAQPKKALTYLNTIVSNQNANYVPIRGIKQI